MQNEIKVKVKDDLDVNIDTEIIFDNDLKARNYLKLIDTYMDGNFGEIVSTTDSSESDKTIDKNPEYYSRILESFKNYYY